MRSLKEPRRGGLGIVARQGFGDFDAAGPACDNAIAVTTTTRQVSIAPVRVGDGGSSGVLPHDIFG